MFTHLKQLFSWLGEQLLVLITRVQNPPVPVAPVIVPGKPVPAFDVVGSLTKLILAHSTSFDTYYPNAVSPNKIVNTHIGKISSDTARTIAGLLANDAVAHGIDLAYCVGQLYEEAHWSPDCYNHNLNKHGGVVSFEGTDWGITQNSGTVLKQMPQFAGKSEAEIQATVLDPTWSIPEYLSKVVSDHNWAELTLASGVSEANLRLIKPQWQALLKGADLGKLIRALPAFAVHADLTDVELPYWLAAITYNAGRTGALEAIAAGGYHVDGDGNKTDRQLTYGHNVITFSRQFRVYVTAP